MECFDPKCTKYPYTEYTDQHYLKVKKNWGIVFDKDYPYIDKSKSFEFKRKLIRLVLYLIVFPVSYFKLGLKIKGRRNIRRYKDVLKGGVVSIANHIHLWDYIAVMNAVKPFRPNVIIWAPNINGENGKLMRMVGGIPIPENDPRATVAFSNTIDEYLSNGGWLHIYPEGSMWEYYAPIRPFKLGAASIAVKNNKPIMPFGFSYRKPGFIRSHLFHMAAKITITVGEPIFRDESLPKNEQIKDLTLRAHKAVCELSGINYRKNIYEPIFNNSKKINYY